MYRLAYCLSLLFLLPQAVLALGLGELKKHSELNQPFRATIDLVDANAGVLDTLRVKLADAERFRRAGIERPHVLTQLRFEVVETDAGPDYIQITSQVPIREPYLNFLIEVTWSSGTLFREYAALLDPPAHHRATEPARPAVRAPDVSRPRASGPRRPAPASVAPTRLASSEHYTTVRGDTLWEIALRARPDRSVSVQQVMMALLRANPDAFFRDNINALKAGAALTVPEPSALAAVPRSEAQALTSQHWAAWEQYRGRATSTAARAPMGAGTVASADSDRAAPPGGSGAADAELKLLAANTVATGGVASDAGSGAGETGKLRKDLGIAQETLTSQKQEIGELNSKLAEADEIIKLLRRQIDVKDAELAALQAKAAAEAPGAVAEPPTGLGSESPPAAGTGAALPGDAPASDTPAPEGADRQPADTQSATDTLGEDLQAQAPAGVEPPGTGTEDSGPTEATAPGGLAEGADQAPPAAALSEGPETAASGPSAAPAEPASPRAGGFLDIIPGGAATLGIGIALILGSVAVLMRRKRAAEVAPVDFDGPMSDESAEVWEADAREHTPRVESVTQVRSATEETTGPVSVLELADTAPPAAPPAIPVEEEEALSDINVYLAYERFDEAEAAVKQAIAANPDEHKLKLKLLEVYYAAGNNAAFEQYAGVLQSAVSGTGPLWHSALAMWQAMSPDRALFTSTTGTETLVSSTAPREFIDISSSMAGADVRQSRAGRDEAPPSAAMGGTLEALDFDLTGAAAAASTTTRERIMDVSTGNELEWDGAGLVVDTGQARKGGGLVDLGAAPGVALEKGLPAVLDVTVAEEAERSSVPESTIAEPGRVMWSTGRSATATADRSVTVAEAAQTIDIAFGAEPEARGAEPDREETRDDLYDLGLATGGPQPRSAEPLVGGATIDLQAPDWPELSLGTAQASVRSTATAGQPASSTLIETHERDRSKDDSVEFDLADLDLEVVETTPPDQVETITMVDMGYEAPKSSSHVRSLGSSLGGALGGLDEEAGADTVRIDPDVDASSELDVKLNLAKAYIELGDAEGARAILQEVSREGTPAERDEAAQLLAQIA